jgi:hypothetical protein
MPLRLPPCLKRPTLKVVVIASFVIIITCRRVSAIVMLRHPSGSREALYETRSFVRPRTVSYGAARATDGVGERGLVRFESISGHGLKMARLVTGRE